MIIYQRMSMKLYDVISEENIIILKIGKSTRIAKNRSRCMEVDISRDAKLRKLAVWLVYRMTNSVATVSGWGC